MNVNKNSPYRQTDFNKNKVGQFMLAQVGQFWLALKLTDTAKMDLRDKGIEIDGHCYNGPLR